MLPDERRVSTYPGQEEGHKDERKLAVAAFDSVLVEEVFRQQAQAAQLLEIGRRELRRRRKRRRQRRRDADGQQRDHRTSDGREAPRCLRCQNRPKLQTLETDIVGTTSHTN